MFKRIYNQMKLNVKITLRTPLLVSSGKTMDVTRPDSEFIRINTPDGETLYIPGSSLKGVLRSGMEALLSEGQTLVPSVCIASDKMCHDKADNKKKKVKKKLLYKDHCAVCRLFGSGDMAARLEITDVFPYSLEDSAEEKKKKIEKLNGLISTRTGIKINRKTGKTQGGALFQYEILGGGELYGEFTFTNFELYQPGVLFSLFELSREGFLRYGRSKSRGLGVLDFCVERINILQTGRTEEQTIKGISELDSARDKGFYSGTKDLITVEGDRQYEDQILYSTLIMKDKDTIASVVRKFTEKTRLLIAAR